jgi:hypothetical protein
MKVSFTVIGTPKRGLSLIILLLTSNCASKSLAYYIASSKATSFKYPKLKPFYIETSKNVKSTSKTVYFFYE